MNNNIADEAIHSASQTMSDLADAAKDYAAHAIDNADATKDRALASMRRCCFVGTCWPYRRQRRLTVGVM